MPPKIPLNLRIKKKSQKDVAYAQDILISEIYSFFPKAVIHGGTAIWRCYNGNRFSEDVDVYIPKDKKAIENFFTSLEKIGFKIIKKRIKDNSVYSELAYNETTIKFEATFQVKKPVFKKYETSESFFIGVYTLSPEDLLIEKIDAYLNRKKIRDLYDIYFLRSYAENGIRGHVSRLIKHFESPADEKNLATIILSGSVPSSDQLIEEIKRWVK